MVSVRDMMKIKNRKIRRGISLMEIMGGLIVGLMMYGNYNKLQQDSVQNMRAHTIADAMRITGTAAETYARTSSDAFMKNLGDNQVVEVPFSGTTGPVNGTTSLLQSGLIPYNYNPGLPFGQRMAVLMKKIPATPVIPSHIESMVLTYGGADYSDGMVGRILNDLGGNGGGVMHHTISGVTNNTIQGSYGTWSSPASAWSANGKIALQGHVALTNSNLSGSLSEFMNRFNIGNPEANRMHTNIVMNNFNLNNVNMIDGVPGQDLTIGASQTNNNVITPENVTICQSNGMSCGIAIASDAYLSNESGWTTLFQDKRGLHVVGTQGATTAMDGAIYLSTSVGDENPSGTNADSHRQTGLMFNYTDADTFGAHMFENSAQFLTLTGANGFTGLNIKPQSGVNATVQMLSSKFYTDGHGLLSIMVPNSGIVAVQHVDGSLADISANAINLGMSTSVTSDGNAYPAVRGGQCKPNGRIAASTSGSGATLNCIDGRWWDITDPYSNEFYVGPLSGYHGNNSNGTQIVELTQGRYGGKKDDPFAQAFVNGQQVCINSYHAVKNWDGATNTCTFPVPPGAQISGGWGSDWVVAYGLPY